MTEILTGSQTPRKEPPQKWRPKYKTAASQDAAALLLSLGEYFRPPPNLTVSEWADRYRILPREGAAEPGPWSTDRTPYLREIMDALSPYSGYEEIVFKKSAQVGGTECGMNLIGFIVHLAPANVLVVQPTLEVARDKFSKQRLAPTIAATPVLEERVADKKTRDSGNTLLMKEFPGGSMILTGANSAAGLRSMPIQNLILDEIDEYPKDVGGQGDPIGLAVKRTTTFARRKIFKISTPTEAGVSNIESAYDNSDRRRYYVPCPLCNHKQPLEWELLRFKKSEEGFLIGGVHYQCRHCGEAITEDNKTDMLDAGTWIADSPGEGRPAGFWINGLYSPWEKWTTIAEDFLQALRENDPHKMKVFKNTVLAQVWEPPSEKVDSDALESNVSRYGPQVPARACVLTAAVDVQKDRLEYEVVAWGPGLESWGIEYGTLRDDPTVKQTWADLEALLQKKYIHESGVPLGIRRVFIDSGYLSQIIYDYCRGRWRTLGHYPIKGFDTDGATDELLKRSIVDTRKIRGKKIGGVPLYSLRTNPLKDILFTWLVTEEIGPGYCHFPEGFGYTKEYFKQLTAEQQVMKNKRRVWEKRRPGLRNEALDLRVYNLAAVRSLHFDPYRYIEAQAKRLEREAAEQGAIQDPDPSPEVQPPPTKPTPPKGRGRRKGFVNSWK